MDPGNPRPHSTARRVTSAGLARMQRCHRKATTPLFHGATPPVGPAHTHTQDQQVRPVQIRRPNIVPFYSCRRTLLKTKTGMASMMRRFTSDTSLVRTQYLVVDRLNACIGH